MTEEEVDIKTSIINQIREAQKNLAKADKAIREGKNTNTVYWLYKAEVRIETAGERSNRLIEMKEKI